MGAHELVSRTDEWWTPAWVFEALGARFDMDPCGQVEQPGARWMDCIYSSRGLERDWNGHIWLNPPFGGRNAVVPWLEKLVAHGDGIALLPNRTGCDWWQDIAAEAHCLLFHRGKIKFVRGDGGVSQSPGFGNVFMAFGGEMRDRLWLSDLQGLRRQ